MNCKHCGHEMTPVNDMPSRTLFKCEDEGERRGCWTVDEVRKASDNGKE
jgi:hypothetical protein